VVAAVEPLAAHEAMLRLEVGGSVLLARVTRDAVARLSLHPGLSVWAMIKSVAFDHGA
jgi:molybdate transport system ATP-binding protein